MTIFPDGRAIIKGTTDVALAGALLPVHRELKPSRVSVEKLAPQLAIDSAKPTLSTGRG